MASLRALTSVFSCRAPDAGAEESVAVAPVAVPAAVVVLVLVAVALGLLGSAGLRRLRRLGNVINLGSGRTSRSSAVFVAAWSCRKRKEGSKQEAS